jgi:hypothetical protein
MNGMKLTIVFLVALGTAGGLSTSVLSQQGGGSYQKFAKPEGQEVRSRRLASQLMAPMGLSEREWQVLVPKIDKVYVLMQISESGGGDGRPGATYANPGMPTALSEASCDFRRALVAKESTSEEIQAKLQKLREEKAKIQAELAEARAELRAAVGVREQAALVLNGLLD